MSDARPVGSCGIWFTVDVDRMGPLIRLAPGVERGERSFTVVLGTANVNLTGAECREVGPMLIAFGNGERPIVETDEKRSQIAALRSKSEYLIGRIVEVERCAQKGLVTLDKRHRAEIAERDVTIMRLRAALKLGCRTPEGCEP